jgi:hypothetical protein
VWRPVSTCHGFTPPDTWTRPPVSLEIIVLKRSPELIALTPDVILGPVTSTVRALLEITHTTPIVFAVATDPVGGGLVASLARPGGNVTGFSIQDFGLRAKARGSAAGIPRRPVGSPSLLPCRLQLLH